MIKSIREMTGEELENISLLGLEDTFLFSCKVCGKCCKNRHDLILTPYDVYRIAKFFSRQTGEIIKRYCDVYEGRDSRLPVVRVKPIPPDDSCPFLRNKKCVVQKLKPVLCRAFPLAKVNKLSKEESGYYLNEIPKCNHGDGPTTVRDWVGDIASEESDRAATEWAATLKRILTPLHDKIDALTKDENTQILNAIFTFFYLMYDTDSEFAPQLKKNTDVLFAYLQKQYGFQEDEDEATDN